jgi:hypothetical protein
MRTLTQREQDVLAHVVVDPAEWWKNANDATNVEDADKALAAKVRRWGAEYDADQARLGEFYETRAERDA